ncbi:IKK1 [Cordylochernes scorpioides]|uniref:IKK1 n=1 Tax=Cordylochernes scorpioides TaxID=51811 RepID=A0ABY6KK67_9ARAC|nr:IKK1 [Cordylochernes scorpioides]
MDYSSKRRPCRICLNRGHAGRFHPENRQQPLRANADQLRLNTPDAKCGNPITHPLPRLPSTFHIGFTTEPVKVDRMTEDKQRMTEIEDEHVADALTNMQPHCEDLVSRLADAIRGLAVPRVEVVNGIGKKREAESNGQKFQVDRPRPVRTPATVSKVKRLATTENPPSQRQLSRMCGTSLKTINNIIHKDLELDTRRKGKVHKLTPFHMKNRATNARKLYEEHLAGSRSEYTATLDEAWMYVTYCNGIRKICYIKRGNQVPDNWVHQCSETFPKGFMVVGVMTGRGVLPLIKVPSKVKVNSEFYIECVLKPVIEQLKDLYPGEMDKVFLHHDKASSHTSNKTQQFLQEMKDTLGPNFIRNSDIPVKSPDASPLDFYGFGMLKQRLFNRRPKTEAGLWKAAQEEWSNVSLSKVKEVFAAWKGTGNMFALLTLRKGLVSCVEEPKYRIKLRGCTKMPKKLEDFKYLKERQRAARQARRAKMRKIFRDRFHSSALELQQLKAEECVERSTEVGRHPVPVPRCPPIIRLSSDSISPFFWAPPHY